MWGEAERRVQAAGQLHQYHYCTGQQAMAMSKLQVTSVQFSEETYYIVCATVDMTHGQCFLVSTAGPICRSQARSSHHTCALMLHKHEDVAHKQQQQQGRAASTTSAIYLPALGPATLLAAIASIAVVSLQHFNCLRNQHQQCRAKHGSLQRVGACPCKECPTQSTVHSYTCTDFQQQPQPPLLPWLSHTLPWHIPRHKQGTST